MVSGHSVNPASCIKAMHAQRAMRARIHRHRALHKHVHKHFRPQQKNIQTHQGVARESKIHQRHPAPARTPPPNTHKHNTFDSTPSTPSRACSQRQLVDVRCNGRPTYIYSHLSNVEVQYMCVCVRVCVHLYIHCKYIIHTYIHKCDVQIQIYLRCIR